MRTNCRRQEKLSGMEDNMEELRFEKYVFIPCTAIAVSANETGEENRQDALLCYERGDLENPPADADPYIFFGCFLSELRNRDGSICTEDEMGFWCESNTDRCSHDSEDLETVLIDGKPMRDLILT